MTATIKDCPQADYPIRDRAYAPEQIARIAEHNAEILSALSALFGLGTPTHARMAEIDALNARVDAMPALEASRDDD